MTTITKNNGFNFGPSVLDAIAEATQIRFTWHWVTPSRKVFFANGYKFSSPKAFGEYMITEANSWMIENGLVDLNKLSNLNQGGHPMFSVV